MYNSKQIHYTDRILYMFAYFAKYFLLKAKLQILYTITKGCGSLSLQYPFLHGYASQ